MGSRTTGIRLNDDDHKAIKTKADEQGISIGQLLKSAALERPVKVIRKSVIQQDPKMVYELNRIGNNINQMSHQMNRMAKADFTFADLTTIFNNFNNALLSFHDDVKTLSNVKAISSDT